MRYSLLCACMAMAAAAAGSVPHQVLAGMCMLASAVMMVWFCLPESLPKWYEHMCFSFKGQWNMLTHFEIQWRTRYMHAGCKQVPYLVLSICDALYRSNIIRSSKLSHCSYRILATSMQAWPAAGCFSYGKDKPCSRRRKIPNSAGCAWFGELGRHISAHPQVS